MTLTRGQRQVAILVAQGLTNKEIAHEVKITQVAVKVRLCEVYRRCGILDHGNSRVRLARLMWRDEQIQRCDREIAWYEREIREGKPNTEGKDEMEGLLLGLKDWCAEKRLLEADNG